MILFYFWNEKNKNNKKRQDGKQKDIKMKANCLPSFQQKKIIKSKYTPDKMILNC